MQLKNGMMLSLGEKERKIVGLQNNKNNSMRKNKLKKCNSEH
jgi:hypothetical protein